LRKVGNGVIIDIGCGGGFTIECVLQSIQPSVYSVSLDIDFECAKRASKRAELLGMSDRSMGICADAIHLPFADHSFSAAYTRYGFNHIKGYADALKEVYRILKNDGTLVVTEDKTSWWHYVWQNEFARIGLDYEGRIKVMKHLGCFTDIQDFIENVKQVGFDITNTDDASYVLIEAIKR
jgi:ubiquinone/menaquinone biosynthesis C-methylase UbiE